MAVTACTTWGGIQTAREGGTMKVQDSRASASCGELRRGVGGPRGSVLTRTAPAMEKTSWPQSW